MKKAGGVFQVMGSILLTIILAGVILIFGVGYPFASLFSEKRMATTVSKSISAIADEILELEKFAQRSKTPGENPEAPVSEPVQKIVNAIEQAGVEPTIVATLLKDEKINEDAGEFISSVILNVVDDGETEVKYPPVEKTVSIAVTHREEISELARTKAPEKVAEWEQKTPEEFQTLVQENYDKIINSIQNFLKRLKEG